MANHIPYGYRIENGVAVIDEGQAEQVRTLFSGYLSGLALVLAAEAAGLTLFHGGAKRMLQNEHYLGDDFYPAIIDSETFSKVATAVPEHWEESGSGQYRHPAKQRPPLL